MKKERYDRTELDIFEFQAEDVIMTSESIPVEEQNELPIRGNR